MEWSNRHQTSQNFPSCSSLFCWFLSFHTFATLHRGLLLELSWDPTPPTHFLRMIEILVLELSGTLIALCMQTALFSRRCVPSNPDMKPLLWSFFSLLRVLPLKCNVFIWNQLHTTFTSYIIYLLSLITIGFVNVFLIMLLFLGCWYFIIWHPLLACRAQA